MGITADRIREQGFLDEVVREPLGGAHRDFKTTAANLKETIDRHLNELIALELPTLLDVRYQRIMGFGSFEDTGK
jgi:acetyl-CoA carboxylase carboxyl transferase subunit alpha